MLGFGSLGGGGNWFAKLFGFTEMTGSGKAYQASKDNFAYDQETGILSSKPSGRQFQAGRFTTPTLAEMREQFDSTLQGKVPDWLRKPLRVQEVVGDVSDYHVDVENNLALFQAASQFNCLEFVGPTVVPEAGITGYSSDRTQGPACAVSCAPGTVVRNYFAFAALGSGEGQTAEHQVECLKDVEHYLENRKKRYFVIKGGYSNGSNESLTRLGKILEDQKTYDEVLSRLRIGVQWDTQVTSSRFGSNPYEGPQLLVSQAYCSACAVAYSSASSQAWRPFAELVLRGAYEATMYAALQNAVAHNGECGSKRVFLTALGGGVFGNDEEWIAEAMRFAFEKFAGVGLEVYIVSFGRNWRLARPFLRAYRGSAGGAAA
jgi:hypothetical protein